MTRPGAARATLSSRVVLLLAPVLFALAARPAGAGEPTSESLVLEGAAMAIPAYFVGVAMHEGSHALAVASMGAKVTELRVLPGFRDGSFYFGYTRWRGRLSRGEKAWALLAPKATNLIVLGAYSCLVGLGGLPASEHAQLALAVFASAHWIDFTKSAVSLRPTDDVVRVHALYGRTSEWQRAPYRLLHLGVATAAAFFVARGYEEIFDEGQDVGRVMVPIAALAF